MLSFRLDVRFDFGYVLVPACEVVDSLGQYDLVALRVR